MVQQKCANQISDAKSELNQIETDGKLADKTFDSLEVKTEGDIKEYRNGLSRMRNLCEKTQGHIDVAKKTYKSMSHLKNGSILQLGQITTISKMRISNPKMKSDSLFGIKLSRTDMASLNEKLKNLYIFEPSSK